MSDIQERAGVFHTRGYQQELLEESLRSNIIIALDTGSGKTHIAVLRMKHEFERESRKVRCSCLTVDIVLICAALGFVVPRTDSSARSAAVERDPDSDATCLQDFWGRVPREVEEQDAMARHPGLVQNRRIDTDGPA